MCTKHYSYVPVAVVRQTFAWSYTVAHHCLRANDHYNRDIAIMFGAQLLSFRAFLRAEIAQQSAVSQFAEDADYGLLLRVHCPAIVSESGNSRATLFQIETH